MLLHIVLQSKTQEIGGNWSNCKVNTYRCIVWFGAKNMKVSCLYAVMGVNKQMLLFQTTGAVD